MDSCKKLLKLEFIQLSRESFGSSSHVLTHGILPSHGVLHLEYRIEFEKTECMGAVGKIQRSNKNIVCNRFNHPYFVFINFLRANIFKSGPRATPWSWSTFKNIDR